jgi:hypothetical protein
MYSIGTIVGNPFRGGGLSLLECSFRPPLESKLIYNAAFIKCISFLHNYFVKIEDDKLVKLRPVMVYIHGGLYLNGGSDLWKPHYFMDEDVVIVTINYR